MAEFAAGDALTAANLNAKLCTDTRMDTHETANFSSALHGHKFIRSTSVFAGKNAGKTITLGTTWVAADYIVRVFATADPDEYVGDVYVAKGTTSFIVYNSGKALTAFQYEAVNFNS